jgi:hypothetical protein
MKAPGFLLLFTLCFTAPSTWGQDFWQQLPFPDSLEISCVAFNPAGDIFVTTGTANVTDGVFRSTDKGQTWAVLLTNGNFGAGPIAVNDSGHIYLHTYGFNRFFASYDNGNSWVQKSYPVIAGTSRIYCLGADTLLVASGKDDGVILLRTPDRCATWDTIFETFHHESESISDIAIAADGTIYLSLMCFIANQGGVYKATDKGETWQCVGLVNSQVMDVELNPAGDLYIGVYYGFVGAGGIFVQRHNSSVIDTCLYGPNVNGLVVNPAGDIYAGIGWPDGVVVSKDNGATFEFENSGLGTIGPMGQMEIDKQNYIYALQFFSSSSLYRTSDPTYVSLEKLIFSSKQGLLKIYPNPVSDHMKITVNGKCIPDGEYKMALYDMNQKAILIRNIYIGENEFNLELGSVPAGVYGLQLIAGNTIYFEKFVKR